MKTFTIDADDNIGVFSSVEEAGQQAGVDRFHSLDQLMALTESWPASRLVEIWNSLTGVKPVKKFKDRKTAVERIWTAIQRLQPVGAPVKPKSYKAAKGKPRRHTGGKNTKTARMLALLKQPSGASLKSLMKASGWQAHSVRGFLSGHLGKKLGLHVKSFQRNGERVYSVRG
jgi:Protein of unknown function (DUF3489)